MEPPEQKDLLPDWTKMPNIINQQILYTLAIDLTNQFIKFPEIIPFFDHLLKKVIIVVFSFDKSCSLCSAIMWDH